MKMGIFQCHISFRAGSYAKRSGNPISQVTQETNSRGNVLSKESVPETNDDTSCLHPKPKRYRCKTLQTVEINYLSTDAGFLPPTVRLADKRLARFCTSTAPANPGHPPNEKRLLSHLCERLLHNNFDDLQAFRARCPQNAALPISQNELNNTVIKEKFLPRVIKA